MRKYLQVFFAILGVLCLGTTLMWLGTVIPRAETFWIIAVCAACLALVLFIGYKGKKDESQ